jgi:hypothetical protein
VHIPVTKQQVNEALELARNREAAILSESKTKGDLRRRCIDIWDPLFRFGLFEKVRLNVQFEVTLVEQLCRRSNTPSSAWPHLPTTPTAALCF